MSADPSASIWEVTRMILDSPEASPSVIAHAHGFSAFEVTELLPIFLDNLRADFSADGPAPALVPPAPRPGETPEEHADRYLRDLAQNEHLDVVGYDTLGVVDGEADLDGDLDPTLLDPAPEAAPSTEFVELDDTAAEPDEGLDDLEADDPFAASAPVEIDLPAPTDSFDDDLPGAGVDDPGEPFAMG